MPSSLRSRRPWWAWLLAVVCFGIAVVALTTAQIPWILGLFGLGAALTVMNIAGSTERTPKARLVACLMVTAAAWFFFILFGTVIARL